MIRMGFSNVLYLFLLDFFLTGVASQTSFGCPTNLEYKTNLKTFQGVCYQFIPVEKDWYEARDYCRKFGGKLVSIQNQKTNEFLKGVINSLWWRNNGIWIGLNDLDEDGHFTWTGKADHSSLRLGPWFNWGSGHPGAFLSSHRDCIRMARDGGYWKWHETPCSFPGYDYRFICQYETVQPAYSSTMLTVVTSPQKTNSSLQAIPVHDYIILEEPKASLQQSHGFFEESPPSNGNNSSVTQVILLFLTCILVIVLVVAFFIYRRRQQQAKEHLEGSFSKNSHLENVCIDKAENIYIDEATQKFLKSKEVDKAEGIYEEIPYDLAKVEVIHV